MRARLSLLYFLQFSVWGCYLTCFGQLLGAGGLGADIAWFYAAIGVVSILTPWLFGRLADTTGSPEKLLGTCHLIAAFLMFVMWQYARSHAQLEFSIFYPLYIGFLAFYMPTMALANTTSFGLLAKAGKDTVKSFPAIRIWGTVGFVGAMWFVNSAYWQEGHLGFAFNDDSTVSHLRFQYNAMQLFCSGIVGIVAGIYSLSLPKLTPHVESEPSQSSVRGEASKYSNTLLQSLSVMFSSKRRLVFLIFVVFSGVCMQISNGFVTPFINHFMGIEAYARSLASGNATMLFSLSQISEAATVLLVGVLLPRIGIRWVYALGLLAWSLRFLFLGFGNPGDGLWLLIGSMIVYGIAFNFITIAGHLHIQRVAPEGMKGFAQGLMMFMSNGIGATCGTLIAGKVINHWCEWKMIPAGGGGSMMRLFMGEWVAPWVIFATYAAVVGILWMICYTVVLKRNK